MVKRTKKKAPIVRRSRKKTIRKKNMPRPPSPRLRKSYSGQARLRRTSRTKRVKRVFKKKKLEKIAPLRRFEDNPIIAPHHKNSWESRATFNPAALYEDGKIHILYRALGDDDVSVLGYAGSRDGHVFDERLAEPAYAPRDILANLRARKAASPISYLSGGGGLGGTEDPRIVKIGDRLYLTFLAFNGWDSARMALTSISWDDFVNKKWNWDQPIFLSAPGEVHKNWVLFPEKINGKFAVLHSISPRILIDYFHDLRELEDDTYIHSYHGRSGRTGSWDNWVRGAGPPPIKTKHGWLLLYHAMDERDPNRYKLGAMLLDLHDPTKILYRSARPVLEPDETYENEGHKAGVIYSCGAVTIKDKLLVYYGGADKFTCVAEANLAEFIADLIAQKKPELKKFSS